MCGRYVNVASDEDLTEELDVEEVVGDDMAPSWNIAPTDPVRAVVLRRPHGADDDAAPVRQLRTLRWGLVPNWSNSAGGGAKMINARIETVATKPAFRRAAALRRCLLPSAGYYEWQAANGKKIAHFLHGAENELLTYAGLYELWRDPELPDDDPARWLWTCTIITQPAADTLGHIHDRSPVIVPAALRAAWLDCSSQRADTARELLDAVPDYPLEPEVVSPAVGNVRNNGPELIEPVGSMPEQLEL